MATHLINALSRTIPEELTDQQKMCALLHFTHVALENEVRRACADTLGSAEPTYGLVIGEYHHVSHNLSKIMHLHACKAQAGAIRNTILRLQEEGLWDLHESVVVSDHDWIFR